MSVPLDPHLYGLSNANYLTTSTEPYNSTSLVPPAGSAAIEAGTALSGILATMPVRWQYSIASNSLIPRLDPLTIGAVDYAAVAATPTFSPTAGDYGSTQPVTISDATPGVKIYYAINGKPTISSSVYSPLTPIVVSASETINAIATAPGYLQSAVGSAAYTINLPIVATPIFSVPPGPYTSVQIVAIHTATTAGNPVIYYTADGSDPATSATAIKYTTPVTVSVTEALNAVAEATGYENSAIASVAYTINLPFAGPTYTQSCSQTASFTTSVTCTLNGVGAGHTLVIAVVGSGIVQSAKVTSSSGTPTLAVQDGDTLSAYILPDTSAGTISITATVTANQNYWLSVYEYSNTAVSPLDGTSFAVATSWAPTSISTPDLITTAASDTLWNYCLAPGGYTFTVGSAPIPWTALPGPTSGYENFAEDGPTTSPGTYFGQCDTGSGVAVPEIITLALKPPPLFVPAELSTPTPGSVLSTSNTTFTWTAGTGVTRYELILGVNGPGSTSVYNSGVREDSCATEHKHRRSHI